VSECVREGMTKKQKTVLTFSQKTKPPKRTVELQGEGDCETVRPGDQSKTMALLGRKPRVRE
jgi:hypothetical protein